MSYMIDIGDDASDAPSLRDAIADARRFVTGQGVMQGRSWVNVDRAIVSKTDRNEERRYLFAIWADYDENDERIVHESRDPVVATQQEEILNGGSRARFVAGEAAYQESLRARGIPTSAEYAASRAGSKDNPALCPDCGLPARHDNPAYRSIGEGAPPPVGTRVQAYRNLNIRGGVAWSVRVDGIVVAIVDHVLLSDVTLTVRESGRQRVLRDKSKNVHAWVDGSWEVKAPRSGWERIRYNPYKYDSFVRASSDRPLHHVPWAKLDQDGAFAIVDGRAENPASPTAGTSDEDLWNG